MECFFVTALYKIHIPENLGKDDKINDTTFITNDRDTIRSLLSSIDHVKAIGLLEANAILNASTVVYSYEKAAESVTPEQHLISKLYLLESFLTCLWFFTDHSINDETGYYFFGGHGANVTSNFLSSRHTLSNGEISAVTIKRSMLKRAREFYRNNISLPDSPFSKPKLSLVKNTTRIERSLYHVMTARGNSDIGFKISSYCSALEALLSSSQAELAHQLSERAALLLSSDVARRIEIYRSVKKAYNIRSKIVHGDYVRHEQLTELISTSEFCDQTIRGLLMRIICDPVYLGVFTHNNSEFDEKMLELICGGGVPLSALSR